MEFETAIRVYHIYKDEWKPTLGEKLNCVKDTRGQSAEYDENAIGVYLGV